MSIGHRTTVLLTPPRLWPDCFMPVDRNPSCDRVATEPKRDETTKVTLPVRQQWKQKWKYTCYAVQSSPVHKRAFFVHEKKTQPRYPSDLPRVSSAKHLQVKIQYCHGSGGSNTLHLYSSNSYCKRPVTVHIDTGIWRHVSDSLIRMKMVINLYWSKYVDLLNNINKTGNVCIRHHWDAFMKPLLLWKSHKSYLFVCVCVRGGGAWAQGSWRVLPQV
jgi:hypothetical protein